jgi:hypothetical protein
MVEMMEMKWRFLEVRDGKKERFTTGQRKEGIALRA